MECLPLISIVVPIYKVEMYLSRCIESLLEQTYHNLEIILVEDGSPDRCGEICDNYACKDNRIAVIHQENSGVSAARNAGIDRASGKYLAFVDSDDWVEESYIQSLYEAITKKQADMAICGHVIHDARADHIRSSPELEGLIPREDAIRYLLDMFYYEGYLWNKLFITRYIKSAGQEQIRLDPAIYICEDLLFVLQYLLRCQRVCYFPAPLYHYVIRAGSALNSYGEKRNSELLARQKIIELLEPITPELYATAKIGYFNTGINLLLFAARDRCRDLFPQLRRQIAPFYKQYMNNANIPFKNKLRVWAIYFFPVQSNCLWLFLKRLFHLRWKY